MLQMVVKSKVFVLQNVLINYFAIKICDINTVHSGYIFIFWLKKDEANRIKNSLCTSGISHVFV